MNEELIEKCLPSSVEIYGIFNECIPYIGGKDRRNEAVGKLYDLFETKLTKAIPIIQADRDEKKDKEIEALHRERRGEVWYWQGDSEDKLESLTCHVLIEAQDLRNLLADRDREIGEWLEKRLGDRWKYSLPPWSITLYPSDIEALKSGKEVKGNGKQI